MPDHLHLLVEGLSSSADFRLFLKLVRRRTSVVARSIDLYPLWQDGYYERVLRKEEATPEIIRYIMANPVRAGLVDRWQDYPFSWAAELS